MPVVYNPYARPYPPQYPIPMAGGGPMAQAAAGSAAALGALAAGIGGKAALAAKRALTKQTLDKTRKKRRTHARTKASVPSGAQTALTRAVAGQTRGKAAAYKRGPYAKKVSKWEHRYPQIIKQHYWMTDHSKYMDISAPNAPAGQMYVPSTGAGTFSN